MLAPGHSWALSSGLTNEVTHLSSLRARGSLADSLVPYRKELGRHGASWMVTPWASSEWVVKAISTTSYMVHPTWFILHSHPWSL